MIRPKPLPTRKPKSERIRKERAVTLIAALRCKEGIILTADSEQTLGDVLKTSGEKIRILQPNPSSSPRWVAVLAGAGDVEYIRMAGDIIQEKLRRTSGTDAEVIAAVREGIHETWRDFATYEPRGVQLALLVASFSTDRRLRLTVVNGSAVREGATLEAKGMGDAMFLSVMDRFVALPAGLLHLIPGNPEALRFLALYAAQAAKRVPAVGGMTRMVTLTKEGELKWVKSEKVLAVQSFFTDFHFRIKEAISGSARRGALAQDVESLVKLLSDAALRDLRRLRKKIEQIDRDSSKI